MEYKTGGPQLKTTPFERIYFRCKLNLLNKTLVIQYVRRTEKQASRKKI